MAKKSFIAAPAPVAKRESEKDILDHLEEKKAAPITLQTVSVARPEIIPSDAKREKETSNKEHSVASVPSVPDTTEPSDIKQSFIIREDYLERLKDYVHMRKVQGDYDYTQKQALHESLDLLFKDAKIERRPERLRLKEDLRRDKIRKGKAKS